MVEKQPAYIAIAQRKQAHLNSLIPPEWRLPEQFIPPAMKLSPADSIIIKVDEYKKDNVNLIDIPRICGILTATELEITEKWDVKGLLREIGSGRTKAEDAVKAFCKRAAVVHQLTRCLTEPLFSSAIEQAKNLDSHLQRTGKTVGPLHGLPITVKDSFFVKGVDSCVGFTALAFKPAPRDSSLVELLRSLGAVIISKTNIPQGMMFLDSVNPVFGRTLNPFNCQLTPGGSSGGEGVVVAMRGSMIGIGTDIGGSIRVPAMCNGIYGFKPSVGRVPFGGQNGAPAGKGRAALQAVAGPIARSLADIDAVMKEIVPRSELFDEECIPGQWRSETPSLPENQSRKKLTVGILRSDGLVEPLPPIAQVLDEVAQTLRRRTDDVEVVEIPTPPSMPKCQRIAGRLMDVDGGAYMWDQVEETSEPLMPWLQARSAGGRRPAITVEQLYQLHAQRAQLEHEMREMWTVPVPNSLGSGEARHRRTVDAIICPIAPHPVPEIDRWNSVGYASMFVLLDYPAGTIPVRNINEADLNLEIDAGRKALGSWDKKNRELWDCRTVDRRVYLNSPLSVQVVSPRQHDYGLFRAMEVIDSAIRKESTRKHGENKARL